MPKREKKHLITRIRLLYKIILTFLLVIIVPLLIIMIMITTFLYNDAQTKTKDKLASGIRYVESLISNEKSNLQVQSESILENIVNNQDITLLIAEKEKRISNFLASKGFEPDSIPEESILEEIILRYRFRDPGIVSLKSIHNIDETLTIRTDILKDLISEYESDEIIQPIRNFDFFLENFADYIKYQLILEFQVAEHAANIPDNLARKYNLQYLKIFQVVPSSNTTLESKLKKQQSDSDKGKAPLTDEKRSPGKSDASSTPSKNGVQDKETTNKTNGNSTDEKSTGKETEKSGNQASDSNKSDDLNNEETNGVPKDKKSNSFSLRFDENHDNSGKEPKKENGTTEKQNDSQKQNGKATPKDTTSEKKVNSESETADQAKTDAEPTEKSTEKEEAPKSKNQSAASTEADIRSLSRAELLKHKERYRFSFEEILGQTSKLFLHDYKEFLNFMTQCYLSNAIITRMVLTQDGLVVVSGRYIEIKNNNYIFIAGKLISNNTLLLLKKANNLDFSILSKREYPDRIEFQRTITTLYNGFGESLAGKIAVQNRSQLETIFHYKQSDLIEQKPDLISQINFEHLSGEYLSYSKPLYDDPTVANQSNDSSKAELERISNTLFPYAVIEAITIANVPEETRRIQYWLLLMTLVILVLVVFASYFMNRGFVDPIRKLLQGIKTLSKKVRTGQKFDPVYVRSTDETSDLATAFNEMANDLYKAHFDLKQYSEHLEDMVEERTKELNELNKALQEQQNLINKEMVLAKNVQQAILPNNFFLSPQIDIAALLRPMAEVSGDFYDIFMINNRLIGIIVADVSGHGVPSALITAMAKVSFTNESLAHKDTKKVCEIVNKNLTKLLSEVGFYLTAFFIILDIEELWMQYTNAGHHKALLLKKGASNLVGLDSVGFFIGSIEEAEYESNSEQLSKGDKIYIYTDGIIEARNTDGNFYDDERLMHFILNYNHLPSQEFCKGLLEDVEAFCFGELPNDDRTVLVIEVR